MPDGTKILCNAAQYIRDVTVPDAMKVRPGEHFTKVWELKNAGYCTWTPDYKIILTWGNPMGTEPPLPFGKTVLPGESVEISIKMVAPYIPLCWQGNWMLQDPLGNRFGVGVEHANAFYVLVFVHIPGLSRFLATCEEE